MTATVNQTRTGKFIDWWAHLAFGSFLVSLLTLIASPFLQRTLLSQNVVANQGEVTTLPPIELKPHSLGAMSVDAEARIGNNEWVTFEIQLLDKDNQVLATGVKEAWRENGVWNEEGESGTWDESDTVGGVDVKAKQDERLTVAIALGERGTVTGAELDRPVPFQVTVKSGVVDAGYLWLGTITSLLIALITRWALQKSGKKAIAQQIDDSDVTGRETVGGSDKLVRVRVDIEPDETAPDRLEVRLVINNNYGEQVYVDSIPVSVKVTTKENEFQSAKATLEKYFVLSQRDSYGFHVEVYPDQPIDKTRLTVRDGVRTFLPVDAVEIHQSDNLNMVG